MSNGEEFEFDLPATHGDLVTVDGYDERLFMVIAYQLIRNCLPEEEYNEIVFEVLDAYTGEYLEVDGEDVEFVTDASQASEYVRANAAQKERNNTDWKADVMNSLRQIEEYERGMIGMAKEERKLTPREISGQEAERRKKERKEKAIQIDNLLDMRKWNSDMLAKTNNEEFGDRVFAIDCELKKLTEVD